MSMMIKKMSDDELNNAIPFVWSVFSEYEAANYTESGGKAFWDVIHDENFLKKLTAYGAYMEDHLVGVIATRSSGTHIALFFVDGEYQRRGIGRALFDTVLRASDAKVFTVNSSVYAVPVYEKLGFIPTDEMHIDDGIKYIPMEYRR